MKTAFALSFLLVTSGVLAAVDNESAAREWKALAGSWKLASVQEGGETVPKADLPAISFILKPDGTADVRTPDGEFQTRSVIDSSKTPKTLDIEYLGGPLKGQKQFGIYKIDGDRLIVFSTLPGAKPDQRPREFDAKTAKGRLIVWQRSKEAEKR